MRPNLLPVEVRSYANAGWWGDRGDNFAVIRWLLHRLKLAVPVAHDVKGDAHGVREGVGLPAGLVFNHEAVCPPALGSVDFAHRRFTRAAIADEYW
jgi:hypothetical protein